MPLADIPAETALVGSESLAVARQPVGLIVEHVVTLWAVGHASTVSDDVALSPCPPPTAKQRSAKQMPLVGYSFGGILKCLVPPFGGFDIDTDKEEIQSILEIYLHKFHSI